MKKQEGDVADSPAETRILRDGEVSRLTEILENPGDPVTICAISGAGGVGKTFLVEHVLNSIGLEHSGYLKLSADGVSTHLRGDFIGLVDQKFAVRTLHSPATPGRDYFPSVRLIAEAYASLIDEVERELDQGSHDTKTKQIVNALIKGGQILNKLSPKTKGLLNFAEIPLTPDEIDATIDVSVSTTKKLQALAIAEPSYVPRLVKSAVGMTLRNRIRRELHEVTADYLYGDICKCVGRRKVQSKFGIKIPGHEFRKLLIVLDDFEVLGPVIADFVFGSLLPKLESAQFTTTLFVIGRDDFSASNPDWDFRYQRYVQERLKLAPFTRDQAMEFLGRLHIETSEAEEIYKYTEGFPFLMKLVCEERGSITAADIPRQFFDRTTRWMSSREIDWFKRLVYLDRVDADTLAWFFPSENIDTILYWFEREGSNRDPSAKVFTVRGIIRDKVLKYLSIRHPSEHKRMLNLVKERLRNSDQP